VSGDMEGVLLQGLPSHPKIRTTLPAAFQRPRIDIDGGAIKREWRPLLACDLQPGDTVPGIGVLTELQETLNLPTCWEITVFGGDGNQRVYNATDLVFAFTAVKAQDQP
jgi:hypothetical protein